MSVPFQSGFILDGKFELLSEIGSGGLATVYRARQIELGRTVAIKVIHQSLLADEEFQARFIREAQALCQLSHPNIVTVYQLGIADDMPFMAMELVEGRSLASFLNQNGRMDTLRSLRITKTLADALHYVHQQGIVHRDLKPANIILVENAKGETVKLIDFGLARFVESRTQTMTGTGELLGTPEYMSPEQCLGKKVDFKSDIYSLCASLYEVLTGEKAFSADTSIGLLYKHMNETVPKLQKNEIDHYHSVLDDIIGKGMEKNPDDRFSSMSELSQELEKALLLCQSGSAEHSAGKYKSLVVVSAVLVLLIFSALFFMPRPASVKEKVAKKSVSSNLRIEKLLKAASERNDDEARLLNQEAYVLSINNKVAKSLQTRALIAYGLDLMCNLNLPYTGLSVSSGLAKFSISDIDLSLIDYARLETLQKFGEETKAKELLADYVENMPLTKLSPPVLIDVAIKLNAPKFIEKIVERSIDTIDRLVSSSSALRQSGKLKWSSDVLSKTESLEANWVETWQIANAKFFQLLAERKYKQAFELICKTKESFSKKIIISPSVAAVGGLSEVENWKYRYGVISKLQRVGEFFEGANLDHGAVDSAEVPAFFQKLSVLHKAGANSELLALIHEKQAMPMSPLHQIQLINLELQVGWDSQTEPTIETLILLAREYRIMQHKEVELPKATRLNFLYHQARMFRYLGDFENASKNHQELLRLANLPNSNGEDPFLSFDANQFARNKLNYAEILLLLGKKDQAKQVIKDFDVDQTNAHVVADLLSFQLEIGDIEGCKKVLEDCNNLYTLFALSYPLLDTHRLELARRNVERIRTLRKNETGLDRYLHDAELCVIASSVELEDGKKENGEKIYRDYVDDGAQDPEPSAKHVSKSRLYQRLSLLGGIFNFPKGRTRFREEFFRVHGKAKGWE